MHCTTKYTGWPSSINNGTFFNDALASLNCSIAETLDCTFKCNDAYIIKEQSHKIPEWASTTTLPSTLQQSMPRSSNGSTSMTKF
jgi:hypothetical protein